MTTTSTSRLRRFVAAVRPPGLADFDEPDELTGGTAGAAGTDVVDDEQAEPEPGLLEGVRTMRLRHQYVPFAVIGLLHAGAAIAHSTGGFEAGVAVSGLYLALAIVYWWAVGRKDPMNRRRRRRYTTVVAIAGAAWVLWAATMGAGGWDAALLWTGGYGLALPYWRRHAIPTPPIDEPEGEPEPEPEPVADDELMVPQLFAANVAAKAMALPGAYLFGAQVTMKDERYIIQLRPGAQDTRQAIAAAPKIASALGLDLDSIVVDWPPSRNMSQATLLVVRDNPLRKTLPYPGPEQCWDDEKGIAWIGRFPDFELVPWYVIRPGWGVCGGIIIGSIGSGKSRLMEAIAATAAYTGRVAVWVADPQGGQSFPAWAKHSDWGACQDPGEGDEILLMLRAMYRIIQVRGKVNSLFGRPVHECTPEAPAVLGFLDECHTMLNIKYANGDPMRLAQINEAIWLVDSISRMGRKAGVGLILATQYPGLESFGNKDSIRSNLAAGNQAILRTASKFTKGMIAGLELDPSMLPDRPGTGYLVGERTAPFRGWLTELIEQLAAEAPKPALEKIVANRLGATYADRHQRRTTARAELATDLADLDPDLIRELVAADPAFGRAIAQAQQTRATRRTATPPANAAAVEVVGPSTAAAVTPAAAYALQLRLAPAPVFHIPTQRPDDETLDDTTDEPIDDDTHGDDGIQDTADDGEAGVLATNSGRQIYELIRAGISTKQALIERSQLSESRVRAICNDLKDAGLVDNPRHGHWTTTDTAA